MRKLRERVMPRKGEAPARRLLARSHRGGRLWRSIPGVSRPVVATAVLLFAGLAALPASLEPGAPPNDPDAQVLGRLLDSAAAAREAEAEDLRRGGSTLASTAVEQGHSPGARAHDAGLLRGGGATAAVRTGASSSPEPAGLGLSILDCGNCLADPRPSFD